jgi:CelD/BcsL family acetyltransferase involved in cellulose biosynthesis
VKVDALDSFAAVGEAAWQRLLAASGFPSPFMAWAWQTAWFEAFGASGGLSLLRVRDGAGEVAGLLPLVLEPDGCLRIVGGVAVSDYLDVVARAGSEEEVWGALLQNRSASPQTWDLHGVRAASPTAALVPALAPVYGLVATRELEERCPAIDLPATWDDYLAGLAGKQRHELRRKMRRLERELAGPVAVAHATPDDVLARLNDFLVLHRASRAGKARFMDGRMESFFRTAIVALAARGMARLWTLDAGGRAVAAFICLEWAGRVGLYNSGFDTGMAALSPGIVLLAYVIRDAIERGLARFDFLRGEEPYKLAFGAHPEDLWRIRVSR